MLRQKGQHRVQFPPVAAEGAGQQLDRVLVVQPGDHHRLGRAAHFGQRLGQGQRIARLDRGVAVTRQQQHVDGRLNKVNDAVRPGLSFWKGELLR